MTTGKAVLLVGGLGLGAYVLYRFVNQGSASPLVRNTTAPPPRAPSPPNPLAQLENSVNLAGVPVSAVGKLAQSAPTWSKVLIFPVGVTSVTQSLITHPEDTAKRIGSGAVSIVKDIGSIF